MQFSLDDLVCVFEKYLKGTIGRDAAYPSLMFSEQPNLGFLTSYKSLFNDQPITVIKPAGSSQGISTVTLTFGLTIDAVGTVVTPGDIKWAAVLAELSWGQGSGNFTALVDVFHGSMVTLTASNLTVKFRSASSFGHTQAPEPYDQISVNTAVTWGTRAARGPVTRTFLPEISAPGFGPLIPIPNFAYAMDVFVPTGTAAGNVSVEFHSATPAGQSTLIATELGAAFDAGRVAEGVKIPATANFFRVNNLTAGSFTYTTGFRLTL